MKPNFGSVAGLLLTLADRAWVARETVLVRRAVRAAAALLMPLECVGCGRPDLRLCPSCTRGLRRSARHPLRVEEQAQALPLNTRGQPLPVVAAGKYDHELASVILSYKNHQMVALEKILVPLLAAAVRTAVGELTDPSGTVLLVPLPTRRQARASRGYWPVGLLLHRVAAAHLLPAHVRAANLLGYRARASWGKAQKGQGRRGRTHVRNTMRARATPGAKKFLNSDVQILFVDDVLTTGATLAEAYRALAQFPLNFRGAVVIAGTSAPAKNAN